MAVGIRVEGLEQIRRDFADAPKEMRKQLRLANKEAAAPVVELAQVLVPVRTGALRRSIKATSNVTDAFVRAGGGKVAVYAPVVHFGWPKRGRRPQPFLYQAADRRITEVYAAYEKAVERILAAVGR